MILLVMEIYLFRFMVAALLLFYPSVVQLTLFGNVLDSADYVFTLTNTGTDTLTISEIDLPLAVFDQDGRVQQQRH